MAGRTRTAVSLHHLDDVEPDDLVDAAPAATISVTPTPGNSAGFSFKPITISPNAGFTGDSPDTTTSLLQSASILRRAMASVPDHLLILALVAVGPVVHATGSYSSRPQTPWSYPGLYFTTLSAARFGSHTSDFVAIARLTNLRQQGSV